MNRFGWFAVAFLQDCLVRLHWVGVLFIDFFKGDILVDLEWIELLQHRAE